MQVFIELASSLTLKVLLMYVGIVIKNNLHNDKVQCLDSIINGMLVAVKLFKRLDCLMVYTPK